MRTAVGPQWEVREVRIPRGTSREAARRLLTEAADIERWELQRVRMYPDGRRIAWLRRKVYKVVRTA